MIFCDECYKCPERKTIEQEHDLAKDFWRKYQSSYVFPCGSYYNPIIGFDEVHKGCNKQRLQLFKTE